jgi:NAD(P)-dependent dehydrogenase (short-subunit alcohol dehydrogenase family)
MTKPLAVIVGAGPGIGMAVARRFHLGGFRVAVVSRPSDPLAAFQADLDGLALGADLAREDQLEAALAAIEAWGGLPEVLVCNASAGAPGPAAELSPARLRDGLQVSVGSALAAVRWALPAMRAAGRGTLLFTGGGLALKPEAGLASAALGKAALRSLALSLGQELAPEGIHAATVTIGGFVQQGTPLSPERVAQTFWELHLQKKGSWEIEQSLH